MGKHRAGAAGGATTGKPPPASSVPPVKQATKPEAGPETPAWKVMAVFAVIAAISCGYALLNIDKAILQAEQDLAVKADKEKQSQEAVLEASRREDSWRRSGEVEDDEIDVEGKSEERTDEAESFKPPPQAAPTILRSSTPLADMEELNFPDSYCEARRPNASVPDFARCVPPSRRCRRFVMDEFISTEERDALVHLANWFLNKYGHGGGAGGPSLLDLNKGVVSYGPAFADLHKLVETALDHARRRRGDITPKQLFNLASGGSRLDTYLSVVRRVHRAVTLFFLGDPAALTTDAERDAFYEAHKHVLRVATPTFFSKIDGGRDPVNPNDEYWHPHVDTEQYGSFVVTTLLYLNDVVPNGHELADNLDDETSAGPFLGGRFVFGAPFNATIEPRTARFSAFTSGPENPHWVEPVMKGTRYAVTTAFTCAMPTDAAATKGVNPPESYAVHDSQDESTLHPVFLAHLLAILHGETV